MASITVQLGPEFHAGDTLNAYPASSWPYPTSDSPDGTAPTVAATATGVVSASGTLTLSGLTLNTTYWVGTGSNPYPYQRVFVPRNSGSVTTDGSSIYGPAGTALTVINPLLEQQTTTTTTAFVAPQNNVFQTGTFVADNSTVIVDVDICGDYAEGMTSRANMLITYGLNSIAGRLTATTQVGQPATGATTVGLGTVSNNAGPTTMHRRLTLTGLTVGSTYRYELAVGIVGYANAISPSEPPLSQGLAISAVNPIKINPQGSNLGDFLLAVRGATKLSLWRLNHLTEAVEELVGAIQLLGNNGSVDIAKNGTKVVVTDFPSNTVTVVDFTVGGVTQPSAGQVTSFAFTTPFGVAITPDLTQAWVTTYASTGPVRPINLTTGALGTAATLPASTFPTNIVITADGTKAVAIGGGAFAHVITTSSSALTSVALPAAPTGAITMFGSTHCYIVCVGGIIVRLDMANNAVTTLATLATWAAVVECKVFSDEQAIMGVLNTASSPPIRQFDLVNNVEFTSWVNPDGNGTSQIPKGLALTDNGSIITGSGTSTAARIDIWYGGKWTYYSGGFYSEHVGVMFEGAH